MTHIKQYIIYLLYGPLWIKQMKTINKINTQYIHKQIDKMTFKNAMSGKKNLKVK